MSICTPEYNEQTRKLRDRVEALRAQLKATQRDATRQTQLGKQSDLLRTQIAEGTVSRGKKGEAYQYNEKTLRALAERDRLKQQADALIERGERLNRSPLMKTLGTILDLERASILATTHVYQKLGGAVGSGHLSSLLGDVTRSGVRHIAPNIAALAPRYGKGFSAEALKNRGQGLKEAYGTAKAQLREGHAPRESLGDFPSTDYVHGMDHITQMFKDAYHAPGALNKVAETARALSSAVGRTHAAEKEFLTQPEYRESIYRRFDHANEKMERAGVPLEQRQEILSRESTHMAIAAKAVADAYEAKLQGKNAFNQGVNLWLRQLERSDNAAYQLGAFAFRFFEPIRNIGVNLAVHYSGHAFGGFKATASAIRWRNGMTEEHAEYIMKNAGQQGAGVALMAVGALLFNQIGGVPGVFGKKDRLKEKDATGNDIEPGEGLGMGTEAFHGAAMSMLLVGASMAQVFENEYGKEKGAQLAFDVVAKPQWAWFTRNVWATDTVRRTYNTVAYGRGAKERGPAVFGEVLGNQLRSMIPAQVQAYARAKDPYKGYRKPKNIEQDLELGIPGYRETVPTR